MIKNNGAEFLIETKNLETIIGNMQRKIPLCEPIMIDRILRRTLYKVKNEQGYHSSQEQIRWIRILDGDIECDGSQCCTITFKDKRKDMTEEDYALLKVDNFDDAETRPFRVLTGSASVIYCYLMTESLERKRIPSRKKFIRLGKEGVLGQELYMDVRLPGGNPYCG